jgi:hypothetical protein
MNKRVLIIVTAIVAVVVVASVAIGASVADDPAGDINRWNVEDRSGPPSPVAVIDAVLLSYDEEVAEDTTERRRRARINKVRVKNRSSQPHRARTTRGGAAMYCRTARGYIEGGNYVPLTDIFIKHVYGTISQRFCYVPSRRKITRVGHLNVSQAVTNVGEGFLWHNDGTRLDAAGAGTACTGSPPYCWEYRYRRGHMQWKRGWGPASQMVDRCVSITMRGTGKVVVGKPHC